MLSELCDRFQCDVEALDPKDDDFTISLRGLILKFVRTTVDHAGQYDYGEIPALIQMCQQVLRALKYEADNAEDRQLRYSRQRAIIDLLELAEAIRRFHADGRQRPADIAALRESIGDALRALVPD